MRSRRREFAGIAEFEAARRAAAPIPRPGCETCDRPLTFDEDQFCRQCLTDGASLHRGAPTERIA